MKIQLASDLHLEFLQRDWPGERIIVPVPGADVLVLAGDIANGTQAIQLFRDWPVPVLYLAGNHEFYETEFDRTREALRKAAVGSAITFLDNDNLAFDGVRFLGTTLWTDYRLELNRSRHQLMEEAERRLNDHYLIRVGGVGARKFTSQRALAEHELSRAWLAQGLSKPYAGKTVVVSHHGPHRLSVHPRYVGQALNAAFVSDLTELLPKADLWLHGHVHDGFDYKVGRCRVVANPAGYVKNLGWAKSRDEFRFENETFDPNLVLEI